MHLRSALVGLAALAALTAFASPANAASGKTKVLCWNKNYPEPVGDGDAQVRVRPSKCGFFKRGESSNSGAVRLVSMNWQRWGARKAKGVGVAVANMGSRAKVAVRLSRVRTCDGKPTFSKATFRYSSRTVDFPLYACGQRFRPAQKTFDQCGSFPGIFTYGLRAEGVSCSRAKKVMKRFIRKSTAQNFPRVVKFGSWRCVSSSYADGQNTKCKRGGDQVRFSRGG